MYLAIDIGGTWTKFGYYKKDGQLLVKDKFLTVTNDIDSFYQTIDVLVINKGVEALALSMPGLIDSESGLIESITLLPFLKGVNIKEDLQRRYGISVSVENDAKCAALGEMWHGSLHGVKNALMMVLGSGIGATIILDGKIYKSTRNKAGEIGSILMPLDMQYQSMTNFGKNNSANAFFNTCNNILGDTKEGTEIFDCLKSNEELQESFIIYCRQIAFMIYNLDYILDLDVVSIGGGISEQPLLIHTIQLEFNNLRANYQEDLHAPNIVASHYKNDANLLGALFHYLIRYENIISEIC